MFGALAGEAGRAQALKVKRLAEEGFVYLAERGENTSNTSTNSPPQTCRLSWPRWSPPRPSAASTRRAPGGLRHRVRRAQANHPRSRRPERAVEGPLAGAEGRVAARRVPGVAQSSLPKISSSNRVIL